MIDEVASPYSNLGSDSGMSTVANMVGTLRGQCSQVPYTMIPLKDCYLSVLTVANILLAASKSGKVLVWCLKTNQRLEVLEHESEIASMKLSPQDKYLAVAEKKGKVTLWELPRFTKTCEVNTKFQVSSIEPQTDLVFVAGKALKAIDTSGRELANLELEDPVTSLCNCEEYLAGGTTNGKIKFWNKQSLHQEFELEAHRSEVSCLEKTESFLVSSGNDSSVKLWNLKSKKCQTVIRGHSGPVSCLAVTEDQKYIISGSKDKGIKFWDLATERHELEVLSQEGTLTGVCVTKDFNFLVSCSEESIRVWHLSNIPGDHFYKESQTAVKQLAFTPDNQHLVVGFADGKLQLHEMLLSTVDAEFDKHKTPICSLAVQGDLMVSGSWEGSIYLWDLEFQEEKGLLEGHTQKVTGLAFEKEVLYSCSEDSKLIVWDLEQITQIKTIEVKEGKVHCMKVANETMILGCSREIVIWSTQNPKCPQHLGSVKAHLDNINSLDILEAIAVSGSSDCTVKVWNIAEEKFMCNFEGHKGPVNSVTFSENNSCVFSASEDKTVKVWSYFEETMLVSLEIPSCPYSILLDPLYANILLGTQQGVYILKNPLLADSITVFPNRYSAVFLYHVLQLLDNKKPEYNPAWNNYIIFPWRINILHILAYANHVSSLSLALKAKAPFFSSSALETPLSMAVMRRNRFSADMFLEHCHLYENNGVWKSFEVLLPALNIAGLSNIKKLYEEGFVKVEQDTIPGSGVLKADPPLVHLSETGFIHPESFLEENSSKKLEEAVEFKTSRFCVNLVSGSEESINFLKSLVMCGNKKVFEAEMIESIILWKWRKDQWFYYGMAFIHLLVMVFLALHSLVLSENFSLVVAVLVLSLVPFSFELCKILDSTFLYFMEPWNIFEVFRLVFLLFYSGFWLADYRDFEFDILLPVIVVLVWIRGIVYAKHFDSTRLLIITFESVANKMFGFMLVLGVAILGFGVALEVAGSNQRKVLTISLDELSSLEWVVLVLGVVVVFLLLVNIFIAVVVVTHWKNNQQHKTLEWKELSKLVLDYEIALFWRRNSGQSMYIQQCTTPNITYINTQSTLELNKQISKYKQAKKTKRNGDDLEKVRNEMQDIKEEISGIKQELKFSIDGVLKQVIQEINSIKDK